LRNILLARSAEHIFWLARYIERAENLSRILDVNATFARDSRGGLDWLPVLQLNDDEQPFFERHADATADAVLHFYVIDHQNPTSIVSAVGNARANAHALRPLISREMWSQLNTFHNWLATLDAKALAPGHLTRLLGEIKEACQTHTGVTEGTFYRDQGWFFYWLGRYLERADQTTRLLDIKCLVLLSDTPDGGEAVDISQWNVLLRSAAAYHPYRRVQPGRVTPAGVARFLLQNPSFPRSVLLCASEAERLLRDLRSSFALQKGAGAAAELAALRNALVTPTVTEILDQGLHSFLDLVQARLLAITTDLTEAFFHSADES
jgi:uncharacterized alpha-E superfamily protein